MLGSDFPPKKFIRAGRGLVPRHCGAATPPRRAAVRCGRPAAMAAGGRRKPELVAMPVSAWTLKVGGVPLRQEKIFLF